MTDEKKNEAEETVDEATDEPGTEPEAPADAPDTGEDAPAGDEPAGDEPEDDDEGDTSDDTSDDADEDADDDADEEAAPAAKKKSARRRRGAAETSTRAKTRRPRPDAEPVSIRAQAKYVRTAPRKARLVVDHIRGKSVEEARAILSHTPRAAAEPILKVLESAVANAEHNHELLPEELRVEKVFVDEGPTLKRFQPRAQGRATKIRKRTSHITIRITNASRN